MDIDIENGVNLTNLISLSIFVVVVKKILSFRSLALEISFPPPINKRAGLKMNKPIFIGVFFLKCRTDITTQERVVIRTTTNYVVSWSLIIMLVTLLIIPNWPLLPDLSCPIPMVTSQRKFLIGAIMTTMIITITTRQRGYCIGVNTSQVPQPTCFWTLKAVGEPD